MLAIQDEKIFGGEYDGFYQEDATAGTVTIHLEVTIPLAAGGLTWVVPHSVV